MKTEINHVGLRSGKTAMAMQSLREASKYSESIVVCANNQQDVDRIWRFLPRDAKNIKVTAPKPTPKLSDVDWIKHFGEL